jgi:HEPN domain-containing protein
MSLRSQERRFQPAYAVELLRIAQADHASGRFLRSGVASAAVRPENAAFHFQQAIEKSLKAVLCHRGQAIPLVHDVGILLARLPDDLEPDFGYELADFDEYAGIRRYEEGHIRLDESDLEAMDAMCEKVLFWARGVCGI